VAGCGQGGGSRRPRAVRDNRMACGGGGGVMVRFPALDGGRLGLRRVVARERAAPMTAVGGGESGCKVEGGAGASEATTGSFNGARKKKSSWTAKALLSRS
jgi:hypothetical protein